MSQSRRIGKFDIDRRLVEEMPEMVMLIMGRCIIVDCDLRYVSNKFEYYAISPDFDEISLGEIEPTYNVDIQEIDDQFKVSFTRVSA